MTKRLLVAAAASSLLAVLGQGVAGAAPTPKYTVTCTVGDRTIAKWQRASLSKVTIDWTAPPGSGVTYPGDSTAVSTRPSHGSVIIATPINPNPATATVTFTRADGTSTDIVTVDCS